MAIDYDPRRVALIHPELGATVFRQGMQPPADAALACEAVRLAYTRAEESAADAQRLASTLALAGYGTPALFNHAGSDGQGFGAIAADGAALLAFRGTQADHAGDLISDAGVALKPWDHGGDRLLHGLRSPSPAAGSGTAAGRVHAGFRNTAIGLWPEVKAWLDGPAAGRTSLLVCGHSLGAAIATLLALPAKASALVTVGSPRVGDAAFAATLSALAVTRIVDCCDVVARVPPAQLGFEHVGRLVYIDRNGHAHADATPNFIEDDRAQGRRDFLAQHAFRFGTVLARELADHAPVNYIRAFWP